MRLASAAVETLWAGALACEAALYAGFPTHSCSVAGHEGAARFGTFVARWAEGTVLDIGCGPQPRPLYAAGCRQLYGLDPIRTPHAFPFVQGIGEALPFGSGVFGTVVLATSLDHCFHPAQVLREAARVLRPQGRLLLWHSVGDGMSYDPWADAPVMADAHHLSRPSAAALEALWTAAGFRALAAESGEFWALQTGEPCRT